MDEFATLIFARQQGGVQTPSDGARGKISTKSSQRRHFRRVCPPSFGETRTSNFVPGHALSCVLRGNDARFVAFARNTEISPLRWAFGFALFTHPLSLSTARCRYTTNNLCSRTVLHGRGAQVVRAARWQGGEEGMERGGRARHLGGAAGETFQQGGEAFARPCL